MNIKKDIQKPIKFRGKFSYLIWQIGWPFLLLIIVMFGILYVDIKYAINKTEEYKNISNESLNYLVGSMAREFSAIMYNGKLVSSLSMDTKNDVLKYQTQRMLLVRPQIARIVFYDKNIQKIWEANSITGDSLSETEPPSTMSDYIYGDEYQDKINNAVLYRSYFPVYDENGKTKGLIVLIFDTTYFWNSISQFNADDVYLFNSKGQMLLSKVSFKERKALETQIYKKYIDNYDRYINFKDSKNEDSIGIARPIVASDWVLVVEKSLNSASAASRSVVVKSIIVLFSIIFLLIIEIIIFRKKIFKPLISLQDMSFKISKGDYNYWSLAWSGNEFDIISMAMSQVVFNAKTLREDLEVQLMEKTKEFDDKIKDSEVLGSFMINRELRMIDIKNELDQVKKELTKCKEEKDPTKNEEKINEKREGED